MTAAKEMFQAADKIQHKPLTDAQWSDAVECYQRAKLMTDAVSDLVKAFAEQTGKTTTAIRSVLKAKADSKESEMRDDLQGAVGIVGRWGVNTAHTPGPWFWSQGVDDWELVGADANRVLFCWSDRTKWKCGLIIGETIKEADSRLIAAAPDMYAVLKELAECSQYWSDYDVPLGIHDRIAAALAKAGGQ